MIVYVLIQVQVGRVGDVLSKVRALKGVVEAHSVTGEYDVICKVEARDLEEVKRIVVEGIHRVEGVVRTVTLIAID
ncbi:MAG: Lrp/AsnC ligand binding domain-containing protein [Sulfolobales archaeon]